jgi:asparagine synthase (glutamine-hydrolysing)
MCGIAGVVCFDAPGICADSLLHLSTGLVHRGPDDHGFMAWSPAGGARSSKHHGIAERQLLGLATRRLSIIDLSAMGGQPMATDDSRYWIAYNGEVYNYVELRSELERLGERFSSSSDTEVVLRALKRWGRAALSRFVGMFALAFFDADTGELLLARDHFGIKPLYVVRTPSALFFASEIPPLLKFLSPAPMVNARRALAYLRFGRSDESDETMIDGIESVRPGHTVSVRTSAKEVGPQAPFWELRVPDTIEVSFSEAASIAREKFLRNIELHLRADVPVGACLSGGVDSSACVAAMRFVKGSALDLHTFTYAAGERQIDETQWASIVSQSAGTQAHSVAGSAEDLGREIDGLIRIQGEPFATTSIYAQHLVFRLVSRSGIKVVLDGQGADEILGGYALFLAARTASAIRRGHLLEGLSLAMAARGKGGFAQAPFVAAQYLLPQTLQTLFRRAMGRELAPLWIDQHWRKARLTSASPKVQGNDLLRSELRGSLTGTLRALLRYEDRNSMAFSVESRLPFLTVDLVEFFLALPEDYLISSRGTTKAVFREAMRGIVPDRILDRRDKISFQTPESAWMRQLNSWAERILGSEMARQCRLVDFDIARKEWSRAIDNSRHYRSWMWRWLNLIRWAEINSLAWPEVHSDARD